MRGGRQPGRPSSGGASPRAMWLVRAWGVCIVTKGQSRFKRRPRGMSREGVAGLGLRWGRGQARPEGTGSAGQGHSL